MCFLFEEFKWQVFPLAGKLGTQLIHTCFIKLNYFLGVIFALCILCSFQDNFPFLSVSASGYFSKNLDENRFIFIGNPFIFKMNPFKSMQNHTESLLACCGGGLGGSGVEEGNGRASIG